jgi:predicted esterase
MAQQAEKSLQKAGATVRLSTYSGGHGWVGDAFGRIQAGIHWLEGKE